MSRGQRSATLVSCGFPRVSGDEPGEAEGGKKK